MIRVLLGPVRVLLGPVRVLLGPVRVLLGPGLLERILVLNTPLQYSQRACTRAEMETLSLFCSLNDDVSLTIDIHVYKHIVYIYL